MKYPVPLAIAYFLWLINVVSYQIVMAMVGIYLVFWLFDGEG